MQAASRTREASETDSRCSSKFKTFGNHVGAVSIPKYLSCTCCTFSEPSVRACSFIFFGAICGRKELVSPRTGDLLVPQTRSSTPPSLQNVSKWLLVMIQMLIARGSCSKNGASMSWSDVRSKEVAHGYPYQGKWETPSFPRATFRSDVCKLQCLFLVL